MGGKLGKLGQSNLQNIVQVKDQHKCGCYIRRPEAVGITFKNAIVPLKKIDYHLQIVNGLANITLRQIYVNPTDQFLEVDYSTPISPQSSIYKFEVEFNNVKIVGIVKDKQEAKKEHEKAKQQGRQAVIGTIDPDSKDIFNIEIGNIPPKTQFVLTIAIMQQLKITFNTFYSILVPATISPRFMNKVDGVVKKPQHMDEGVASGKADYTWSFKIDIKTSRRLVFFDSPSHNIILTAQNQAGTSTTLQMGKSQIPNKDFEFVYTTQNFEKPQYVLGSNDQSSTVMLSFVPKFCSMEITDAYKASIQNKAYETDMEHARGDYCFILDRSGSMEGTRISQARQALLVFLKSLPQDSYFNVISFGDSYQKIFQSSQQATKQVLESAIKNVQEMDADLGGTEIYEPLVHLLQEKIIQGYPRHVFLLTDGGVSNTEGVIKMVKAKAKNSRVHTIGIGTGASINLIEGCAAAGRGKHIIISDNENPAQKIIQLLQSALTPVISKIRLTCNNEQKIASIVPNPKQIPYILKDEPANFYITFKQKLASNQKQIFNFEYEDPITKQIHKADICVGGDSNEGNYQFVDKMGHYKVLKALESSARDGNKVEDNMYYVKVTDYEKEAINYSIKHQILSQYTAFSCIGKQLVDGQYQQYKDAGVHKVYVQQTKPMYYQQEDMYYSNYSRGMGSSAMGMNMKMAMQMDQCCIDEENQPIHMMELQEECCREKQQKRAAISKCQQQPLRIQKQLISHDLDKQIFDFFSMVSEEPAKKQATINKNIVELKQDFSVQDVIKMQNTDGSWTDETLLKLSKNWNDVCTLSQKINAAVVITKLVVLWLQKNHNSKQYALILKKALAWLKKKTTEEAIDEGQLNVIQPK